jgi:hypothetical protein
MLFRRRFRRDQRFLQLALLGAKRGIAAGGSNAHPVHACAGTRRE